MGGSFTPIQAVLIFLSFLFLLICIAFVKKIFFYFKFKKRYYIFPKPSIQGIANIAMVVALSVSVLLLLTFITSNSFSVLFRAFPGSRVTIEGILIKIGGLLFGPFLGMFIGAITDLLSIIMTAGIFHYGHFIAAMGFGILSGLIKAFYTYSNKKNLESGIIATVIVLLTITASVGFSSSFLPEKIENFLIPILPGIIDKNAIIYILVSFFLGVILVIWSLYFLTIFRKKKNSLKIFKNQKIKRKKLSYSDFCLVLVCVLSNELIINVLMMPTFDADLSTIGFNEWFLIRVLLFIPMVFLNFIIIHLVYTIVSPLVKWDYKSELVEDLKVPVYVK